ncbi:helix-turn-helix transcriptional regulator [Phreatobacter stygius]|uniref:AlpA family phage regulatory protein n=1 Tax=Phreatobacter stygius TaxID=1940610 RepID=A0A4D7B790_9HYPH|nr:AlpA family phage regulatory protein [Phreatobacter stygius]QCI68851.1 AlpA family phage regulatory protein [Phreatobacter stygius]
MASDEWLSARQVSERYAIRKSYLDKLRVRGGGPVYCKLGPKLVRYYAADIDAWFASSRRANTSSVTSEAQIAGAA